jgi:hypothetical protein
MTRLFIRRVLLALVALVGVQSSHAQSVTTTSDERPLPDIPTLMHEVEEHQRAAETRQKDYIYHEDILQEQNGGKKTEHREYDVFWLHGVEIHKLIRKDGRDLSADEQKKESERIDKEVEKAKSRRSKAEEKGQQTDSHGHEEVTVSRFLALGAFTNPRRVQIDGRDTIVVDYSGDPKAKTRNRFEDVIRNLAGTLWVDEQDRTISRIEGHFFNNYKIGGGLMVNIKKDTSFAMQQRKINGEVWLPSQGTAQGEARALLFLSFNGSIRFAYSDYRKFKTSATILPGVTTVDESTPSQAPPQP